MLLHSKEHRTFKIMFDHIPKKGGEFAQVPQTEDCETLLSHSEDEEYTKPTKWPIRYYAIGGSVLLFSSLACLAGGIWIGSHSLLDADRLCTEHISRYCTPGHPP